MSTLTLKLKEYQQMNSYDARIAIVKVLIDSGFEEDFEIISVKPLWKKWSPIQKMEWIFNNKFGFAKAEIDDFYSKREAYIKSILKDTNPKEDFYDYSIEEYDLKYKKQWYERFPESITYAEIEIRMFNPIGPTRFQIILKDNDFSVVVREKKNKKFKWRI